MEKFLEKLHQKPRHQRVFVFFVLVSASILSVGYFWVSSLAELKSNVSIYNDTENMEANAYTKKMGLPEIGSYFSDVVSTSKEAFGTIKEETKKAYELVEDLTAQEEAEKNAVQPATNPDETPINEIFDTKPSSGQ